MAKQTLIQWTKQLWDSGVSGGAGAALAAMGLAGANSMGVPVTPLDYKQTGAIFLAGAVLEVLRTLKNKPSPDLEGFGDESTKPPSTSNGTDAKL